MSHHRSPVGGSRLRVSPLLFGLAVSGCRSQLRTPAAATHSNLADSVLARAQSDTSREGGLKPGYYIGSWDNGYRRTDWILVYVTVGSRAATYRDAEVSSICNLQVHRDTVRFLTNELPQWPDFRRFRFSFAGRLVHDSIIGVLGTVGSTHDSVTFSAQFRIFPKDSITTSSDSAIEGVYASVRAVQEAGDVLGDELLLVKTKGRFAAFHTEFAGVPIGPEPADSLEWHGDTVTIINSRRPKYTFVLHPAGFTIDTASIGPGRGGDTVDLTKREGVADLFGPAISDPCSSPASTKVGG